MQLLAWDAYDRNFVFFITVGTPLFLNIIMVSTSKFVQSNSSEKYACKFHKSAIQNKIQKLESNLLKPYLK